VFALLLVAVSVGLDNFGASTAMGVSGVDRRLRLHVAVIFGVFEATIPVVGLLLGRTLARDLGSTTKFIEGGLLVLAGAYALASDYLGERKLVRGLEPSVKRLILIAAALSIDNLVVGFALGIYRVNLVVAAVTIAAVSVALSLLGLEVGGRLGERLGQRSELVGGVVLVLIGVAVSSGLL
jgi:putative Mn2+ efflux pump MntP